MSIVCWTGTCTCCILLMSIGCWLRPWMGWVVWPWILFTGWCTNCCTHVGTCICGNVWLTLTLCCFFSRLCFGCLLGEFVNACNWPRFRWSDIELFCKLWFVDWPVGTSAGLKSLDTCFVPLIFLMFLFLLGNCFLCVLTFEFLVFLGFFGQCNDAWLTAVGMPRSLTLFWVWLSVSWIWLVKSISECIGMFCSMVIGTYVMSWSPMLISMLFVSLALIMSSVTDCDLFILLVSATSLSCCSSSQHKNLVVGADLFRFPDIGIWNV